MIIFNFIIWMDETRKILTALLLGAFFIFLGQCHAQQFIMVENLRTLKNFKYYLGDNIRLKSAEEDRLIEGEITCLSDSMICIGDWEEVMLKDIRFIYRERFGILISRSIFLIAGIGYVTIDSFNRLINNDAPVILAETVYISAGLVGLNFLLIPLKYKRIKTGKWQVEYFDFYELQVFPSNIP
jgi:hypothetical protein